MFCKRAAQCYLKHRTPCISFSKKTSKTCSVNYFRKLRSLSVLHDERNLVLELENTNLLTIQWENVTVSTFSHHRRGARKSWRKASRVITRMTTAKLSLLISGGKGRSFPGRPVISHSLNSSQAIKVEGSEELKKKKKSYFILYVIHKQCHLKGWTSHLKSTRGIQPPQWAYSLVSNKRDTSLKCVLFCFEPSPTPSYYQTMFTGLPQLTHLVWIFRRGQLPKIAFQSWSYSRKKCPKK